MSSVLKQGKESLRYLTKNFKYLKEEDKIKLKNISKNSLGLRVAGLPLSCVFGYFFPMNQIIPSSYPLLGKLFVTFSTYTGFLVSVNYYLGKTAIKMKEKYPEEFITVDENTKLQREIQQSIISQKQQHQQNEEQKVEVENNSKQEEKTRYKGKKPKK